MQEHACKGNGRRTKDTMGSRERRKKKGLREVVGCPPESQRMAIEGGPTMAGRQAGGCWMGWRRGRRGKERVSRYSIGQKSIRGWPGGQGPQGDDASSLSVFFAEASRGHGSSDTRCTWHSAVLQR